MALIKCNECEKEISDKAQSCPHCGNPISGEIKKYNESIKPIFQKEKCEHEITMEDKYYPMVLLPISIIIITSVISQFINFMYIWKLYTPYTSQYFTQPITFTILSFIILMLISFISHYFRKDKSKSFFSSYPFSYLVFIFNVISLGFIQNADRYSYSKITDILATDLISLLLISAALIVAGLFAKLLSPRYKKEKRRIDEIFSYFKKNLPLLNNLDTNIHKPLDLITFTGIKNKNEMLFEMYKRAYLLDAVAIAINSESSTTHTRVSKNGSTTQVTYSLTATPLRYI